MEKTEKGWEDVNALEPQTTTEGAIYETGISGVFAMMEHEKLIAIVMGAKIGGVRELLDLISAEEYYTEEETVNMEREPDILHEMINETRNDGRMTGRALALKGGIVALKMAILVSRINKQMEERREDNEVEGTTEGNI